MIVPMQGRRTRFREHRAHEELADLKTYHRDDRNQRIVQRVFPDHLFFVQTFALPS
jgi:hypothetical protein